MNTTVPPESGQLRAIQAHAIGIRLALRVVATLVTVLCTRAIAQPVCAGDCDGDGGVTVNEIIVLVNMALGPAAGVSSMDRSPLRGASGQDWSLGAAKSDKLLGTQTQLSACANGLPANITDVSQINVSVIIQAVNNALQGSCEDSLGNDCSYYPTASSQAACDAVATQQQCSSSYFYSRPGYSYCFLDGCLCIGD